MAPHDYTGNSNKDKAKQVAPDEEKVVERVTTGVVVVKKPPLSQRLKTVFFGGEFRGATRYVASDVLLPALRNLVVDAITKGAERTIYGESRAPRRPGYSGGYQSRIQYNSPIMRPELRVGRVPDQGPRNVRHEANELVLASRDEAELVLERLSDIIDKYGQATVADLFDLTGLPSSHIDNKWGWFRMNNASVQQVREGYLLNLPAAEEV